MKKIKITIPDNCELIKENNCYIIKKSSSLIPRTWEEFCKNYPIQADESIINPDGEIVCVGQTFQRNPEYDITYNISEEESKAFLALMQLRQLRNAWLKNNKSKEPFKAVIKYRVNEGVKTSYCHTGFLWSHPLSFPTFEMAEEFFNCFKDLCEIAKILL
jgi:hypothetical protein